MYATMRSADKFQNIKVRNCIIV